ncbi:transposase [Deinococcus marmoris]|nr:transposase [Deinococcus marmoris]
MLSLIQLLDDEKCFESVRELRSPDGVTCPHCHASGVVKLGRDDSQRFR